MAPVQKYTQLPPIAESNDVEPMLEKTDWEEVTLTNSKPKRSLRLRFLLAFSCGLLIGIAATCAAKPIISSISKSTIRPHNNANVTLPHDVNKDLGFVISPTTGEAKCGNNWQEAKRLGCHFDVMASRWYSDECYNGEVLETMLKEVDFQWFSDREHTQPVPWELARSGEFDALWPLHDYHIMHCLYLWRRLHSALIEHRQLDDDVYSYGHTLHCTRMIMHWPEEWRYGKNTTTIATSGRPFCRNDPL